MKSLFGFSFWSTASVIWEIQVPRWLHREENENSMSLDDESTTPVLLGLTIIILWPLFCMNVLSRCWKRLTHLKYWLGFHVDQFRKGLGDWKSLSVSFLLANDVRRQMSPYPVEIENWHFVPLSRSPNQLIWFDWLAWLDCSRPDS